MPDGHRPSMEEFLYQHRKAQIDFLAELVRVPSDNPPGDCAPHADQALRLLNGLGFKVESHPVPAAQCQENGMISATNLIIRRRFGDGPTIALNAHGDVVPPGEGWTHDPYGAEIVDSWMYGRGAAVSKSDFTTYAFALLALESQANSLSGTVELHFTYDEEVGGVIGPKWLLDNGLSKPDFVISAGFSYGVVTTHNGCLHLEVEVRGKSAHAATPETGHDSLEAANQILTALYAHRQGYAGVQSGVEGIDSPSLVVGLINGGINTTVVPDRVTLRLDRRIIPEEDPATVEADLRAIIDGTVKGQEGISVTTRQVLLAEPLKELDGVTRLTEPLTRHATAIMGQEVSCHGVPLFTDARHYASAGIPTVLYGAGPRTLIEANGHRADERIQIDDLHKATKVVAFALDDILNH